MNRLEADQILLARECDILPQQAEKYRRLILVTPPDGPDVGGIEHPTYRQLKHG